MTLSINGNGLYVAKHKGLLPTPKRIGVIEANSEKHRFAGRFPVEAGIALRDLSTCNSTSWRNLIDSVLDTWVTAARSLRDTEAKKATSRNQLERLTYNAGLHEQLERLVSSREEAAAELKRKLADPGVLGTESAQLVLPLAWADREDEGLFSFKPNQTALGEVFQTESLGLNFLAAYGTQNPHSINILDGLVEHLISVEPDGKLARLLAMHEAIELILRVKHGVDPDIADVIAEGLERLLLGTEFPDGADPLALYAHESPLDTEIVAYGKNLLSGSVTTSPPVTIVEFQDRRPVELEPQRLEPEPIDQLQAPQTRVKDLITAFLASTYAAQEIDPTPILDEARRDVQEGDPVYSLIRSLVNGKVISTPGEARVIANVVKDRSSLELVRGRKKEVLERAGLADIVLSPELDDSVRTSDYCQLFSDYCTYFSEARANSFDTWFKRSRTDVVESGKLSRSLQNRELPGDAFNKGDLDGVKANIVKLFEKAHRENVISEQEKNLLITFITDYTGFNRAYRSRSQTIQGTIAKRFVEIAHRLESRYLDLQNKVRRHVLRSGGQEVDLPEALKADPQVKRLKRFLEFKPSVGCLERYVFLAQTPRVTEQVPEPVTSGDLITEQVPEPVTSGDLITGQVPEPVTSGDLITGQVPEPVTSGDLITGQVPEPVTSGDLTEQVGELFPGAGSTTEERPAQREQAATTTTRRGPSWERYRQIPQCEPPIKKIELPASLTSEPIPTIEQLDIFLERERSKDTPEIRLIQFYRNFLEAHENHPPDVEQAIFLVHKAFKLSKEEAQAQLVAKFTVANNLLKARRYQLPPLVISREHAEVSETIRTGRTHDSNDREPASNGALTQDDDVRVLDEPTPQQTPTTDGLVLDEPIPQQTLTTDGLVTEVLGEPTLQQTTTTDGLVTEVLGEPTLQQTTTTDGLATEVLSEPTPQQPPTTDGLVTASSDGTDHGSNSAGELLDSSASPHAARVLQAATTTVAEATPVSLDEGIVGLYLGGILGYLIDPEKASRAIAPNPEVYYKNLTRIISNDPETAESFLALEEVNLTREDITVAWCYWNIKRHGGEHQKHIEFPELITMVSRQLGVPVTGGQVLESLDKLNNLCLSQERGRIFIDTNVHAFLIRDYIEQLKFSSDHNSCLRLVIQKGASIRDLRLSETQVTTRIQDAMQIRDVRWAILKAYQKCGGFNGTDVEITQAQFEKALLSLLGIKSLTSELIEQIRFTDSNVNKLTGRGIILDGRRASAIYN